MDNIRDSEMDSGRSMKSRVDELKVRGMEAARSIGRTVSTRSASVRSTMAARAAGVRQDVRSNPAKWVGIVTGAGIGLGLVGRYLRHRVKQRSMPRLVIIEAC